MLNRYFILFVIFIFPFVLLSQELSTGAKFQKTTKMYWENGITVQYSFQNFAPKKFVLGFDYVTSRLGSAINSNAIKQDNYSLSLSWNFTKENPFSLYGRINLGYFYSDYEEEIFAELPNTSFFVAPEITLAYKFTNLPFLLQAGGGYKTDFKAEGYSPGTFQPLYFHFDVLYRFHLKSSHE